MQAGLWLIPQNVAMIIGLNLAPRVAARLGNATSMTVGFGLGAAGLAILTQTDSVVLLSSGLSVTCLGLGLPMALIMNLVIGSAPPEQAGSVASIAETGGEAGIALGVAMLGSLGAVVARHSAESGAQAAFTTGLQVVAAVGALTFVFCAVVSARRLKS